ncbi:DOPEY1 [Cordylochernes scorpioides]|uniref:DOPEY1 n=1 Tax=Cordylochernes scorpioides TaxID=51811 RepID=A0ABY6KF22_9ARAC|nr:DOPEY1 [Cordylochernes scorpioides]
MTTMEEYKLVGEARYRNYIQAVEKALKGFEYTSEWADLISALGKLNKVLVTNNKYNIIPRRITISKRLAQCMHPALPSGVHLKALDTYDIIFKTIGPNRLSQELFIYTAGLFPLLAHAAMNVKPALLSLYETHFVPLAAQLTPCLHGFLMGVLPGLEEGTDYYSKVDSLLAQVCQAVGPMTFYGSLWRCVLTNPSIRLPAITFIISHFNRKQPIEEQLYIIGSDRDIMVQALACSLRDVSVLVQRCALDLLLLSFPLTSSQLDLEDLVTMVTAAITVVLRRDMSLNRRLFSWLMGPDHHSARDYFESNSKQLVLEGLRYCLKDMTTMEEYKLVGEARYRNYIQAVEKALKGFEYTSEWADLISALGKLNKVLVTNNKYNIIPRRITISKRLAQCMHPALPSGVHLKALDTYDIIFKTIGPNRLSQELFIYTAGLFPLLAHAAMNVKPALLSLYETHFVPLAAQLTPCLHGFLMGVLPGLEEGTDYYSKVDSLLAQVCQAVGPMTFYGSLWRCVLTNPSIRLPAITFIISHFNRKQPIEEQLYIIGSDRDIMVQALACSLRDVSVLVQRCALDLLLLSFPLTSSQLDLEDLVTMVTAAITVVLRRDMSLNRRLFSWLMGPDHHSARDYFESNSKQLVLEGLRYCLKDDSNGRLCPTYLLLPKKGSTTQLDIEDPSQYIGSNFSITGAPDLWTYRLLTSLLDRPDISDLILDDILIDIISITGAPDLWTYRLLTSLLDRPDISDLILDDILIDIIRALYQSCQKKDEATRKEIIRTANLLFGTLDPHYLWAYFTKLLRTKPFGGGAVEGIQDLGAPPSCVGEMCLLLEFLLDIVSLESFVEMRTSHLTDLLLEISLFLDFKVDQLGPRELSALLKLSSKLMNRVQPDPDTLTHHFLSFYVKFVTTRLLASPTALSEDNSSTGTEQLSSSAFDYLETYQTLCKLIVKLSSFPVEVHKKEELEENGPQEWLELLTGMGCQLEEDQLALPSLTALLDLLALSQSGVFAPLVGRGRLGRLESLFPAVAARLWDGLDHPTLLQAELLQQVHNLASCPALTEDIVCRALAHEDPMVQLHALKKFCTFWHLSRGITSNQSSSSSVRSFDRCLFFMLDKLSQDTGSQKIVSQDWLNHSIQRGDLARILEPILLLLLHPDTSRISVQHINVHCPQKSEPSDTEAKIYAISSVSGNVIYHVSDDISSSRPYTTSPEKKILALTSLVGTGTCQVVTSPSAIQDYELPPSTMDPISLFVNPFGNFSLSHCYETDSNQDQVSTPIDLTNVHRFESLTSSMGSDQILTTKDIASALVEEVLQNVYTELERKAGCTPAPGDDSQEMDEEEEDLDSLQERLDSFQKITVHHLHTYMLLYCQVYDSQKTMYMLSLLKSIVLTNPRLVLCTMATTTISSSLTERGHQLQTLLARHRKSVFGNSFHGDLSAEATTAFRSNTFIEIVVSLSLYFVRSFYPNLPQVKLTEEEVIGNRNVRLACIDLLLHVFSELSTIVRVSGKSFATYLKDLLSRCKVQKTLLYCLVSNVQSFQERDSTEHTFTETIADFNERTTSSEREHNVTDFQDTFQIHLLRLLTTLLVLEDTIQAQLSSEGCQHPTNLTASKFHQGVKLMCQPMVLSTVVTALNQPRKASLHAHWLGLVTAALPFSSHSLTKLVVAVASQICHSLENTVLLPQHKVAELPADYLLTLIESLTTISHYCLLESPNPVVSAALPPPSQQPPGHHHPSQIISNLIDVFLSPPTGQKATEFGMEASTPAEHVMYARRTLLSHLPRILAALVAVWSQIQDDQPHWGLGSPKIIKQHLLSFISPISLIYGSNFMAAVAVVWYDSSPPDIKPLSPELKDTQRHLVQLVMAIRAMPLEKVVQTVRQVLKQPPPTSHHKTSASAQRVPLELSVLQFFLAYLQHTGAGQLTESWPSLLGLWRDGLQLASASPPVHFLLLALLNEFVQRASLLEDKKDQKDLQDIAQKLIEACLSAAGASLEQTTWPWRNISVRAVPEVVVVAAGSGGDGSVQALHILAEFLAPVLDVVYVSEEKERVVPLLTNIMYYVTPYLRDHSPHNVASFRACSKLLASVSSYQYTRKAWRKDVLELFLDSSFFQLDAGSMSHWRSIIDHLMTHDKTTFREFLGRVAISPSTSLNLFSSKEQEFEQRAQLLKRLAFIVFCSELDQYQRYMPDIQEKLSESLRLGQGTAVQSQVFLCFRVLLLRMSSHHITSLWPVLITELVQVFLQIEHELCTNSEEFITYVRRLSSLDSTWVLNSNNGLNAHNHPGWLHLYLSACKLLDVALALPAQRLPQFQMYRWAFVKTSNDSSSTSDFVPHLKRLASVIPPSQVVENGPPPYLSMTSIQSLQDLHPFFHRLANFPATTFPTTEVQARIEACLEADFLDRDSCQKKDEATRKEIIRTANLLFGTLDPHYLWAYFTKLLRTKPFGGGAVEGIQDLGAPPSCVGEMCLLLEFLLDIVSLESFVEMRTSHLTDLLLEISLFLDFKVDQLGPRELSALLKLSSKLMNRVQPDPDTLTHHFLSFYVKFVTTRLLASPTALSEDNSSTGAEQLSSSAFDYLETYQTLCKLIVKLSSFPVEVHKKEELEENGPQEWLELLTGMGCQLEEDQLALPSLTALLDLLALSQSGVFAPLVGRGRLGRLESLFPAVAARLWDGLDHPTLLQAELLQQVHNLASCPALTEDIVCRALAHEDPMVQLHALKKFCTFWHLSRGITSNQSSSSSVRSFDRCLFFMLDKLSQDTGSQKIVSQDWLNHSIQRGDLARILEPILLLLLHPDTSRISVQHINVHCPQKSEPSDTEAKIYAISSVSGNVIYHVSDDISSSRPYTTSPEKKILALTSLVGTGTCQVVTSPSAIQDYELPPSTMDPISLFVNPFGNFSLSHCYETDSNQDQVSTPIDLTNVHRFESLTSSMGSDQILTTKDIASALVEEVLQNVYTELERKAGCTPAPGDDSQEIDEEEEDLDSLQERLDSFQKITVHHLHTYMLLYCQVYDSQKTMYMLSLLKSIVLTNPRLVLCTMATTTISSSLTERGHQLQTLLARHRKSVFGNSFHGDLSAEATTAFRSNTFIEIVVSLSLYFVRSFYPNLPQVKLTEEEVIGNRNVRLACIDLLLHVFSELSTIVRVSGKSFATYLKDLLSRCKVQKTLLYCLVSNVQSFQERDSTEHTFTETIADFNERTTSSEREHNVTDFQDTFQIHLLRLLTTLLVLEDTIQAQLSSEGCQHPTNLTASKFHQGVKLMCQPMVLSTVVTALNQPRKASLHAHWLGLVTAALPFSSHSLTKLVVAVASQICHSLENTVLLPQHKVAELPADYLLTLIESLTTISHYCLLESPNPVVSAALPPPSQQPPGHHHPSQIISNLIDVFLSPPTGQKATEFGMEASTPAEHVMYARRTLLSHLPRILAALVAVWSQIQDDQPHWGLGSPKIIKQHLLSFISPISLIYGSNFMAAVAVVWYDSSPPDIKPLSPELKDTQRHLVQLVMAIRAMPLEKVVQTVRQVLKQPPPTSHHKTSASAQRVPLELSVLQFFLAYLQHTGAGQLTESWPSLLGLWRDGLQLASASPPVHFLLLALLNEFVQRASLLEDKKDQKDLQDIAQKLIEACLSAAGASLEQTTWPWRNISVRAVPEAGSGGDGSVQALHILAEFLAPVLDVVYVSEEKERVVPLLTNIMYYVTPYLRDHSPHNVASFRACSKLLASVSSYQYTRKAWRKDVLELFLDSSFFQLDAGSMSHWRSIIDHLMTHDKTTFREFLGRVAISPSTSLNLFSSKEQEFEQRAQLLKRLAFIVFCSELDQYQRYMPDIQEKLSESLRLGQGTAVQSQVFLCFRVLLLRMSSHHITSLWPVLITELVQVFLQIEHELCTNSEEFMKVESTYVRRLSSLDSTWVLNSNNGLNAHNHPGWLHLYLSACKLLDVALALPAQRLPQFQMYRWAFVKTSNDSSSTSDFVPHLKRLASVIPPSQVVENGPPPYLSMTSIQSLQDLHPFFHRLANFPATTFPTTEVQARIEACLEADFLDRDVFWRTS